MNVHVSQQFYLSSVFLCNLHGYNHEFIHLFMLFCNLYSFSVVLQNQSARIQKPTPPTTTTAPCADDFFLPYDDFGVEDQVAPLFSSNLIFYSKNNPRNKRFHFLYCNGSGTEPTGEPELISEMEEPKDASSSPKANG
ncbi:uncharacterized protein LOC112505461 [Cynara cardunculus var. scolymus]|uniref:uncharacterized protein LOC112505461 n=1 Tax=Cynara cardunculus var. scolymus TaxID=59895 RepID=UPI000D626EE7|nr:uncharacterized protein LOC112505461 [Cynara cardunculus var. scolymus]